MSPVHQRPTLAWLLALCCQTCFQSGPGTVTAEAGPVMATQQVTAVINVRRAEDGKELKQPADPSDS